MARIGAKADQRDPVDTATAEEERIASLLAIGTTQRDVCDRIGVDDKTVRRLLLRPGFRALVRGIRRATAYVTTGQMAGAIKDAVAHLHLTVGDERCKTNDRTKAAEILLTQYLRYEEAIDTDERLTRIEGKLGLLGDAAEDVPPATAAEALSAVKPQTGEGADENPE